MTVWVDNSAKRIVKIASKSTEKDKQAGVVGTMQASFDYQPVKIEKPQGAVPIATYLLQLNGLLSEDTPVLGDSIELLLPN